MGFYRQGLQQRKQLAGYCKVQVREEDNLGCDCGRQGGEKKMDAVKLMELAGRSDFM